MSFKPDEVKKTCENYKYLKYLNKTQQKLKYTKKCTIYCAKPLVFISY